MRQMRDRKNGQGKQNPSDGSAIVMGFAALYPSYKPNRFS
jgi:hypothetical protein